MKNTITPEQSKDARTELGLSQNYVSKQTGIGRAYMSQFENNYRQLTDSQKAKLRSFYEDEGFIFQNDSNVNKQAFSEEMSNVQSLVSSSAIEDSDVRVKAVELTELLSTLEQVIEDVSNGSSNSSIGVNRDNLSNEELEEIYSDFERGNAAFETYFSLDDKGEIAKTGFLEERHEKIISLMALQYMRYMTVTTGKAFFDNEHLIDEVLSKGKDAKIISELIIERIAESTRIDNHLEGLVA